MTEALPQRLQQADKPALFIESDLYSDVDDVGALALAINLHQRGAITFLGLGINTPSKWGRRAAAVIRRSYGLDFPIGVLPTSDESVYHADYARAVAVAGGVTSTDQVTTEPAARLLRRVLAAAPPGSVTVASIGFFANLVELLDSAPDDVSPLPGAELVRSRVVRTVAMAGVFPSGREFNLSEYPEHSRAFLERWPGGVDFVGFEAAAQVLSGQQLDQHLGADDPVALAYRAYGAAGTGRQSWDPLTVLLAAYPDSELVRWSERGRLSLSDSGENSWQPEPHGPHRYAIAAASTSELAAAINEILYDRPPRGDA